MYSLDSLRADLSARVSLSADPAMIQGWQDAAIREMIDATWWRVVDYGYVDLPVDGTARRWYIVGDNVAILGPEHQHAPDGHATPPFFIPFDSVDWRMHALDDLIVEQGLNNFIVNPSPPVAQDMGFDLGTLVGSTPDRIGVAAIAADTAPKVPQGATAANTYVRVYYQRRCPQPDYSDGTQMIRVPPPFARIATLGYYLAILSDNQAGGDLRLWRKRSDEYLQQAQLYYAQAVPIVRNFSQQADDWLVTGVAS